MERTAVPFLDTTQRHLPDRYVGTVCTLGRLAASSSSDSASEDNETSASEHRTARHLAEIAKVRQEGYSTDSGNPTFAHQARHPPIALIAAYALRVSDPSDTP